MTTKQLTLIATVCFFASAHAQKKNFYVLPIDSKDTVFYEEVKYTTMTNTIKGKNGSSSASYKVKELKAFSTLYNWNGLLAKSDFKYTHWQVASKKPEKDAEGREAYIVMLENGPYRTLYLETRRSNGPAQYYYVFEGDKFLTEVTRKNYREVFPKYFGPCTEFLQKVRTENFYSQFVNAYQLEYRCK